MEKTKTIDGDMIGLMTVIIFDLLIIINLKLAIFIISIFFCKIGYEFWRNILGDKK